MCVKRGEGWEQDPRWLIVSFFCCSCSLWLLIVDGVVACRRCLSGCVDGVCPFFQGDGCKEEKKEVRKEEEKEIALREIKDRGGGAD